MVAGAGAGVGGGWLPVRDSRTPPAPAVSAAAGRGGHLRTSGQRFYNRNSAAAGMGETSDPGCVYRLEDAATAAAAAAAAAKAVEAKAAAALATASEHAFWSTHPACGFWGVLHPPTLFVLRDTSRFYLC